MLHLEPVPLATLTTGSMGKPTWELGGSGCSFNVRAGLLFIYLGHIFISNAYEDKRKGDKYAAILTLLGIVNLPIIKWSVDWWNTLHQPAVFQNSVHQTLILP